MKILCLTSEFPPRVGGIASHVDELTRHLSLLDNTLTVFSPADRTLPVVHSSRLTVYRRHFRLSGWPLFDVQLSFWLRNLIAEAKPDVIHVHGMKPLNATKTCTDIPIVFTNHSSGFLKRVHGSRIRRKRTLRRLDHISTLIAPSRQLLEAAREIGYSGPGQYVPNGVDTDKFAICSSVRSRVRSSWKIDDEPVLLLARRLVPKNGVIDFAKACGHIVDLRYRIVIAGEGPERQGMETTFAEAGLSDRVLFLGSVPNAEMPEVYNAADIAVLPSHMEATSIGGLEAMACGVSLVGTAVGGIPDLITEGVTGRLVRARDPEALATGIRYLIKNPERSRAFGVAARQKVVSQFSWPQIARRTLKILQETAAR